MARRAESQITPEDADPNIDGHQVDLTSGAETEITVKVTAVAGPATPARSDDCLGNTPDSNIRCYTVTVTVGEGSSLLEKYDADENGRIDLPEAVQAVQDYADGKLSIEDVVQVVQLYSSGET